MSGGDVFVRAADGIAGGALTGAWVPQRPPTHDPSQVVAPWQHVFYTVGGYLGVPDALVRGAGAAPGRLLGFDGAGALHTLCTADAPLRAVTGAAGVVYAVGERGVFLRFRAGGAPSCEQTVLPEAIGGVGVTLNAALTDLDGSTVWFAGSVHRADGAREGVLLRLGDGGFERTEQQSEGTGRFPDSFTSLSSAPQVGIYAAGTQGVLWHRPPGAPRWRRERAGQVAELGEVRSVSTGDRWAMALAREGQTYFLGRRFDATQWTAREAALLQRRAPRSLLTALAWEVFVVGDEGFTAVYNGRTFYEPPTRRTSRSLLFVAGQASYVVAVGGDVETASLEQRGVLLVRGDRVRPSYSVDATQFESVGSLVSEFGGGPDSQ